MKSILLTGATDGIGFEIAKLFVTEGHHVIIHGRNSEKLSTTAVQLKALNADAKIDTLQADLSDLKQVGEMVSALKNKVTKLDVIVNNAGVFKTNQPLTKTGEDVRFVVNTISPYLITKSLLTLLADDGRIVNLSSAAQAPVSIAALKGEVPITDAFQAYAQSKLAITIWTQELAKTLKPNQVVVAVNPGSLLASKMVKEGFGVEGNSLSIGADILYRASLSDEFSDASGKYYDNDNQSFAPAHPASLDADNNQEIMVFLEQAVR